ncbi:AfsR/SARP family transcriptional regulator [Euzebya tangerina]|uniref:AfsR/SARP family transcriptional regulator n=1 Tax=Euzebya tangerina TaxID=591198 RepID=UPI000E31DA50|nr:BTAD domain-containing putative transcriptional regulator [Euzebya tangerina]
MTSAGGHEVSLSDKHLALVAYLALEHDRPHDRQRIAELFWPDVTRGRERDNLRLALHKIRGAMGEEATWLHVDRNSLQVTIARGGAHPPGGNPLGLDLDVERLLEGGVTGDHDGTRIPIPAVAPLAPFLPDSLSDLASWWQGWGERVRTAAVTGLGTVGRDALDEGRLDTVHAAADQLVIIDPLAVEGWELHIRGHLRANRSTEAGRLLERFDAQLQEQLGVAAPERLRDLVARAAQRRAEPVHAAPGERSLAQLPLPRPATPLAGRAAELAELQTGMRERLSRLITLVGPGGAGKTRLSLEVATREQHRFGDGAAFVRLDTITDPSAIPSVVGQSLGLSGIATAPDPLERLCQVLAEREVLIVADNLEHLVAAATGQGDVAATVFSTMVRRCPDLVVLATSRLPLGARGERVVPLTGLDTPAEHGGAHTAASVTAVDSAQLLLDRIRRHDRRIEFDETSIRAVSDICNLVGGLPLGLELAASAVRVMTLPEIAETLRTAPRTLPSTRRDGPDRHRDLATIYATTVATLAPADRATLERLAVFVGGFSAEHAGAVADADSDALATLVTSGLLDHQPDGRYRMHELIRQLATAARPDPDDPDDVAARHSRRFLTDLEEAAPALNRAGAGKIVAALDADRGNILAAWSYAVARGWGERLLAASAGLTSWSLSSGLVPEHRSLVMAAAPLATTDVERATWLLREISTIDVYATGAGPIPQLAERIRGLDDGTPQFAELIAKAELERGYSQIEQESRLEEGRAAMLCAADLASGGSPTLRAFIELRLGYQGLDVADFEEALQRMTVALRMFEDEGHLRGVATARKGLAHVHDERFDLWPALQEVSAAEETFAALGNRIWVMYSQELRGTVLTRLGHYDEACEVLEAVVQYFHDQGGAVTAMVTQAWLGVAQIGRGQDDDGFRRLSEGISAMRTSSELNMLRFQLFDFVRALRDRGRRLEADLDVTELIRLNTKMESAVLIAAGRVLRAHVRLPDGITPAVEEDISAGWAAIRDGLVGRLLDPLATLLEAREVLEAMGRTDDAAEALVLARDRLRAVAGRITDADARRRFLQDVPACRAVLAAT